MKLNPNQKIEISHDILAREVYARIDAGEKMRLKITQFLRDRYDYYVEAGALLDKKDLDYIALYLEKVQVSPEQTAFIKESRREVAAKARRRQRRNLAIGTVLALATVVSIFFGIQADQKAKDAREAQVEALAQKASALAAKGEAEIATKEAETAKQTAQEKEKEARASALTAETQRQRAEATLNSLNQTRQQVVDVLIEQSQGLILELNYEEAFHKLKTANTLLKNYRPLGQAFMEMVFFYSATYQLEQAGAALDKTIALFGRSGLNKPTLIRQDTFLYLKGMRSILSKLDAQHAAMIQNKYFPEMVTVPAGSLDTIQIASFRMAKYETTNWQYNLFCLSSGQDSIERTRERWPLEGNVPVVKVSWTDALRYCNWLNGHLGLDKTYSDATKNANWNPSAKGYRLPTEAEWEYAARGGPQQAVYKYSGSDDEDSVAWYDGNSNSRPHPVGGKMGNNLDLFDLSGNVWEWCWDKWSSGGTYRGLRGGSWLTNAVRCEVSNLNSGIPGLHDNFIGFRCVFPL
ncbi:MAG: SUMF1/EgtB/PvdO family nonheme iron enzyme [Saprospiraceae bacterium]